LNEPDVQRHLAEIFITQSNYKNNRKEEEEFSSTRNQNELFLLE